MARRRIEVNEIVEIIYHWHKGNTIRGIKRALGFDRKTIRKYIQIAQELGVKRGGDFPDEQELVKALKCYNKSPCLYESPAMDCIVPYRWQIEEWLEDRHMTAKQIWRLLKEDYGLTVGYSTVKRYLKREFDFRSTPVTVRIETPAGEVAQVDFGYAGLMYDPESKRMRKTWAFIMTLCYSRHRFVRFVFRMDSANWIDCHIRAFEFFGGVPGSVVLDNLKPGVIKPDIYDPTLNRGYADLERHYGFVADPAKVRSPKLKGKVERVVPVVRQHLLAGREFKDIDEANKRALIWCKDEIGREIHGTTKRKPYEVFLEEERKALKPLSAKAFEIPLWKSCSVHPDHHVVFDKAYYSVPTRYIGKEVWVKGTRKLVKIFHEHELIKVHVRAKYPGQRVTDMNDYPPEKLAYLMATPTYCREKASEYGPFTERLIRKILSEHAMRNLRKAQGILRLGEKYGKDQLERACKRAWEYGNYRYKSIKAILDKGLFEDCEGDAPSVVCLSPLGVSFLRSPSYFAQEVS
jgi:transposase